MRQVRQQEYAPIAVRTAQPAQRRWFRWRRLPLRYAAIVLGCGLLMFAGSSRVFGATPGTTKPQVALVLATALAGMASLIAAGMPISAPPAWKRLYRWLRALIYVAALLLMLGTFAVFAGTLALAIQYPASQTYVNDVISFTHVNAGLVLAGKNPYTSDDMFMVALREYPQALPTALRRGLFGTGYDSPAQDQLVAMRRRYLANPQATDGSFDPRTLHSYPALSFLLYVPFIWAGLPNILLLNLLVCWGVFAWLAWLAPPGLRPAALLTAAANCCIIYSLPVDTEIICIALLLAAWHLRQRAGWQHWLAPALLGLACAFKQYSWFFVPFLLLEILLTSCWRETLRWGSVALAAFLLPNLPYIIASPGAWLTSLFLPMSDPLFPQGIGIMTLSLGHLLPYGPPALYAALELLALVAVLWFQAHFHARLGDAALLLALVPLLFAFRSPPNYFAFAPWLALYAANRVYAARIMSSALQKETQYLSHH